MAEVIDERIQRMITDLVDIHQEAKSPNIVRAMDIIQQVIDSLIAVDNLMTDYRVSQMEGNAQ
jgi:hypothetical protein